MGFSHFHGRFSNPSPFKGEVRRGMGYICRCSINQVFFKTQFLYRMPLSFFVSSLCVDTQRVSPFHGSPVTHPGNFKIDLESVLG